MSREKYYELSYYTLAKGDAEFIHQYIVDAYAAQTADEYTKPITVAFALVGLYLHLEKNFTGREVQLAHMKMAKNRKDWPKFKLPKDRGEITVEDVLKTDLHRLRDEMIDRWCATVWAAYAASHAQVAKLAKAELKL
jgi:hypothetical protein